MELASSPVRPVRVLIYRVFQGTILETVHEYDVEILQGGKVSRGYTGKLKQHETCFGSGPARSGIDTPSLSGNYTGDCS
jgi:hypothetical protein